MGAGGSILEQGTYEELSASNSAFRDILEAQNTTQKTEQVQIRCDDRMSGEEAVSTPGMMKKGLSTEVIELQNLSTSTLQDQQAVPTMGAATEATKNDQSHRELARSSLWSLIQFTASLNRQEWKLMLLGVVSSIISGAGEPVSTPTTRHPLYSVFANRTVILFPRVLVKTWAAASRTVCYRRLCPSR